MKDRRALVFVTPADVADAPDVADVADRKAAPRRGSRAESFPGLQSSPSSPLSTFPIEFLVGEQTVGGEDLEPGH